MENEEDLFLKELTGEDVMNQNLITNTDESTDESQTNEDDGESEEQKLRNRRERRLAAKLQAERESNIALNARLQAIAEAKKDIGDEADFLKGIDRIYGTDTPEALAATELLKSTLRGLHDSAKQSALEEVRAERQKEAESVAQASQELDQMVEEIEDQYGVVLTKEHQQNFFRLLEKLSPKDSNGNILQYADPIGVYEEYQERLKRSTGNTRARDLAARSMTPSGAGSSATAADEATQAFLRDQGII